jgi:hypothetical protein
MIGRLAIRTLTAHPVRSLVLAAGFGAGVSVMAILLGVAEVVLDQAVSPALVGGGDVLVRLSPQVPAAAVIAGALVAPGVRERVSVVSPWHTSRLFLVRDSGTTVQVDARGGIPSRERALGDHETTQVPSWQDLPADGAWTRMSPEDGLREIDRFHSIPDAPAWSESWAEWLYFNGRVGDGSDRAGNTRFYLTFLAGPLLPDGQRPAGVRLQLERNGKMESFSAGTVIDDSALLASAPDVTFGVNRVRLKGLRYEIDLDLRSADGRRVHGRIWVEGAPGRILPPIEITGAQGWRSGYVVPVMNGKLGGQVNVAGTNVRFDEGVGYHDHNWGFWKGVSWQWGQVQQGDLSFLYGRVFPPKEAADPERLPAFVGALGPDGPLGYATSVRISEENDERGQPKVISIQGRGPAVDLRLVFTVGQVVTTSMTAGPVASGVNFLQMRGSYEVSGRAGSQQIGFTAPGSAETFRGSEAGAR